MNGHVPCALQHGHQLCACAHAGKLTASNQSKRIRLKASQQLQPDPAHITGTELAADTAGPSSAIAANMLHPLLVNPSHRGVNDEQGVSSGDLSDESDVDDAEATGVEAVVKGKRGADKGSGRGNGKKTKRRGKQPEHGDEISADPEQQLVIAGGEQGGRRGRRPRQQAGGGYRGRPTREIINLEEPTDTTNWSLRQLTQRAQSWDRQRMEQLRKEREEAAEAAADAAAANQQNGMPHAAGGDNGMDEGAAGMGDGDDSRQAVVPSQPAQVDNTLIHILYASANKTTVNMC